MKQMVVPETTPFLFGCVRCRRQWFESVACGTKKETLYLTLPLVMVGLSLRKAGFCALCRHAPFEDLQKCWVLCAPFDLRFSEYYKLHNPIEHVSG